MNLNKYNKQSILLYVCTIIGVVLGFAASVLNTSFLSEADYGDVRYVLNLNQFIASLLLFGFFLSGSRILALTDSDNKRREFRGLMILILAFSALVLLACVSVIGLLHFRRPEMVRLFFISLPVCFYPLLTNYINTVAQGDNHIVRLALTRILPPLIYLCLAWPLYRANGVTPTQMILLQWGIYSIPLVGIVMSTKPTFVNLGDNFDRLRKENREYGIHLYVGSLAMVATNYIPGYTLGLFNTDNVLVGFYTLALSLTQPLAYLPGIVGTTYFRQFARQSRISGQVLRNTLLITSASLVCFLLLIGFVVKLYRPEYAAVGVYAKWMAAGFCIHGLGDMINRFLGSHGQGVAIRNSSFLCGSVKVSGFILLVWLWGINGALLTNIVSSTVYFLSLLYYYLQYVGCKRES